MKKHVIIASIAAFLCTTTMTFAAPAKTIQPINIPQKIQEQAPSQETKCEEKTAKKPEFKKNGFDEKLKLTEEQKVKAREIRLKGHQKIKPVIEQIKEKKQEAKMVKMSRIAVEEQNRRLEAIQCDIKKLKKQAREIRMENTKEFEAILTPQQKTEFKKIKEESKKHKLDKHKQYMKDSHQKNSEKQ